MQMYNKKELLAYKVEVQNCKIALENGQLMDCINFIGENNWYSEDDKDYVAMSIIDDIDKKRDGYPTAISYFNQSLEFINEELKNLS